jgi:Carbohydrate binding module (family 6).
MRRPAGIALFLVAGVFALVIRIDAQGSGTPYGGTAISLPGLVQAEDFNEGNAGVAYFDTDSANNGDATSYRTTQVDIETSTDTNGGYSLGWCFATEWLNYTVDVATAGTYDIGIRVASNGVGGTFHIEVDGVDRSGPISVPNTGGWQNWRTLYKSGIALNAGTQVWRLVMDSNGPSGAVGNFNWIAVSHPYSGTAPTLPGTPLQAENFDEGGAGVAYLDTDTPNQGGQYRATAVDIETTADIGGGYSIGWAFAGEWLQYGVNVATTGTYNISFRVASEGSGGTFHLALNGVDVTGPLTVPDTGGWQAWTTITRPNVALTAGAQVWRLVMDTNGATAAVGNFNWMSVTAQPVGTVRKVFTNGTNSGGTYDLNHLQQAIDDAAENDACGSEILIEQNADITPAASDGFVLRQLAATVAWDCITIRTGVDSSGNLLSPGLFPAAGVRMTTAYRNVLAKLTVAANNEASIRTVYPGETGGTCSAAPCVGSGWTLKWLEFAPKADWAKGAMVGFGTNRAGKDWQVDHFVDSLPNGDTQDRLREVPQYLTLIQCDLHGDPVIGQTKGLLLASKDAKVLNNSFVDFKSLDTETQAITGVNGIGPYDIENNYIEGSTENVMFGGDDPYLLARATISGSPTTTSVTLSSPVWHSRIDQSEQPADLTTDMYSGIFVSITHGGVEYGGMTCTLSGSTCTLSPAMPVTPSPGDTIKWSWQMGGLTFKYNWLHKPPEWMNEGWVVKNNFELKQGDGLSPMGAIVIEGNVFDYSWCCSQNSIINIKVNNQDGNDVSATIRNLTFRNNWIRHGDRGISLSTTTTGSNNGPHPSGRMTDVTITNNLFTDLSSAWDNDPAPDSNANNTPVFVTSGDYPDFVGSRGCVRCAFTHNTFLIDTNDKRGPMWFNLSASTDLMTDFVLRDNIMGRECTASWCPDNGVVSLKTYNPESVGQGTAAWNAAVAGSSFADHNAWPDGNSGVYTAEVFTSPFFPADAVLKADLVSYSTCLAGTITGCALQASSSMHNAASDLTDVGSNIPAIKVMTDIALSGNGQ